MDTSGYDPETGRTFTRAEPHEITHEGCVWTDEQIRELVPHGAWRSMNGGYYRAVAMDVTEGPKMNECFRGDNSPRDVYLTPSQVADRVLRCEKCGGSGMWNYTSRDKIVHQTKPCPSCSPLRTLLLKLAQERVEQHHAASHAGTKPNLCWCESCESARSLLKAGGEVDSLSIKQAVEKPAYDPEADES